MKNRNNKNETAILRAHERASATTLRECYGSWSMAKECAYNECKKRCREVGGNDFKIISHNGWQFTIGYYYVDKSNKVRFHYESANATRDFEVKSETLKEFSPYSYEQFEEDYNSLCETTKQHLANSGVTVHSMNEAKSLMRMSKAFDILFKLEGAK